MKYSEEEDDLWQLLGKAKAPGVSPLFARNVLREIRLTRRERLGISSWLLGQWRVVSLGSMAAILLALNVVQFLVPTGTTHSPARLATTGSVQPVSNKKDYDVINHLDELVAYEDHSIWLDESPAQ
jgi:hypothetical protein